MDLGEAVGKILIFCNIPQHGEALPEPCCIHHHAVVLTELISDDLLDWSPGNVIELNVC